MKKPFVIIILLLFSSLALKAQDTLRKKAQPDSVIKLVPYSSGSHTDYLYTVGGKLQSAEDIKMKLLSYQPSSLEFKAAKNNIRWALISAGGIAVSAFAAALEFKNNSKYAGESIAVANGQSEFVYQHHNKTGAYVLTGVAIGFAIAEIVTLVKAGKHSKKALKLYNERFE